MLICVLSESETNEIEQGNWERPLIGHPRLLERTSQMEHRLQFHLKQSKLGMNTNLNTGSPIIPATSITFICVFTTVDNGTEVANMSLYLKLLVINLTRYSLMSVYIFLLTKTKHASLKSFWHTIQSASIILLIEAIKYWAVS
ncbi:hypothetical protein J3Q64DRAFT_1879372 [Phycomyces blakesleeanus]|uniref:Uncharacterized protein n=1 Tax=Phycomyces blakesleeanus TaxID=4837 RepID=A0ABR3B4U2_PHYBL